MTRSNRILLGAGIGLAVAFLVGAYFASPVIALQGLTAAAKSGDRAKLERGVDFPAVRESLKSQLKAAMNHQIASDPSLRDNPFAAFGQLLLGAAVDKVVDTYATPDAISNMVATNRAPTEISSEPNAAAPAGEAPATAPQADAKSKSHAESHYAYQDLNHFHATYRDADTKPGDDFGLVLERRGLFTWKLVKIELPGNLGKR
jgi:hypothetical protein